MEEFNEGDIVKILTRNRQARHFADVLKGVLVDNKKIYGIIEVKHNEYMYGVKAKCVHKEGHITDVDLLLVPSEMRKATEEDLEQYEVYIKKLQEAQNL